MKYFYLSIKILFSICLTSCSSLDLQKEEDMLIIINQDKEKPLKQKPIITTDSDKENVGPLITKKTPIINKSAEKEEAKLIFNKIVKIGLLLPLSGEQKNLGKAIFNSLEMALFETQSKNIKLIFRDSGDTEKQAISAAKELESEGVSILIGPFFLFRL